MSESGGALPDPFASVAVTMQRLRDAQRPVRTVRIWRPWPIAAFSRRDRLSPRFADAVEVARVLGFDPALRPVGGTFAPLHGGSLVVDEYGWSEKPEWPTQRFDRHAALLVEVFRGLGVDARIGEVPGEYCPGAHSVNAARTGPGGTGADGGANTPVRVKVSGTAQRVARGAWLVSSVVQVGGGDALRKVTAHVATALEADLDTDVIGTLDECVPGIGGQDVASALAARFVDDGAESVEWAG